MRQLYVKVVLDKPEVMRLAELDIVEAVGVFSQGRQIIFLQARIFAWEKEFIEIVSSEIEKIYVLDEIKWVQIALR